MRRFAVLLALLLGAVAGRATAVRADAAPLPAAADTTQLDWSAVQEYRIVPGDKLRLDLGPRPDGIEDVLRETLVRPDGRITVYPIGDVIAAGLTPMELQKNLTALLAADLKSPRVTVEVAEMAANLVHVLGRVWKEGSVPAGPFCTVMQAISAAGGFKDDAARGSVLVLHRDGARTVRVTRVNVDRIVKGHELEDIPVGRFDIVYVPRNSIGNLAVFVQQLFGGTQAALSSSLVGWELFNLDRVFVSAHVVNNP